MSILTDPKNALTKQYAKLLEMEGVRLVFEPGALTAAVNRAMQRKTGARALRSIFEKAMLDVMYDIPSTPDAVEVVISADTITKGERPRLVTQSQKKKAG
jgi:ATP-dependent Clp protease ATP-binding subunit ClpX